MRWLDRVAGAAALLWLLLLLGNLAGWNTFLYVNLGEKDLVLAAASGQCQIVWADESDPAAVRVDMQRLAAESRDYGYLRLLDLGPLFLFLETREAPMRAWGISIVPPDPYLDYVELDIPWLVLLVLLLALWASLRVALPGKSRRRAGN